MFVVMGHTRGDDLIRSWARPLYAAESRAQCEERMAEIQREHDEWLANNAVPCMQECAVYARFEVVETSL